MKHLNTHAEMCSNYKYDSSVWDIGFMRWIYKKYINNFAVRCSCSIQENAWHDLSLSIYEGNVIDFDLKNAISFEKFNVEFNVDESMIILDKRVRIKIEPIIFYNIAGILFAYSDIVTTDADATIMKWNVFGKDVSLPDSIVDYWEIQQVAEKANDELQKVFDKQMQCNKERALLLADVLSPIMQQYQDVIWDMLADKGITEGYNDIIYGIDPGWKKCSDISLYMSNLELDETNAAIAKINTQLDIAEQRALNSLGGTRIMISNDFVTMAAGIAAENMVQNHRIKKAEKNYQREAELIENNSWSDYDRKIEDAYLRIFTPEMKEGIFLFSCWIVDTYLKILEDNLLFDRSALSHIDVKASENILQSIPDATDKGALILDALLKAPFNANVYLVAQEYGLLSEELLCIAKVFGIYDSIYKTLRKQVREHYLFLRDIAQNTEECKKFLKQQYADVLSVSVDDIKNDISSFVQKGVTVEVIALLFKNLGKHDFQVDLRLFDTRTPKALKNSVDEYYSHAICKRSEQCLVLLQKIDSLEKRISEIEEEVSLKEKEIKGLGLAMFGGKAKRKKELLEQISDMKDRYYELKKELFEMK